MQAFSAANHWCDYSTKTFIPHEGFITKIFNLLNGNSQIHGVDMSRKVIKIVRKLLNKSKHSNLNENYKDFENAIKQIPK